MSDIEITTTSRGFHQYGSSVETTYGHDVKVYESSAASGPHVWLSIDPGVPTDVLAAHLNEVPARSVVARLQAWLDEIPTRWRAGEAS